MKRVADGVWCERAENRYMGLALGTRMTVVELPGGDLFVHSPVPLTDALKAEVDAIGAVRHVVCPNLFHHVYAGEWTRAYPEAELVAPRALARKRSDLRVARALEDVKDWPELAPIFIAGSMLEETVFVHARSRTLVSSDLTENFLTMDDWLTRQYLKLNGTYGVTGWPRVLRLVYRDKRAAKASLERLYEHDFDRLVLAHGEIIERGAKEALARTFEFLG